MTCWNTGFRDLHKSTVNFLQRTGSKSLVNTPNIIQGVKEVILTEEMEESGESTKNIRGDPRRGLYLLFPVSSCHTTITPSIPPVR